MAGIRIEAEGADLAVYTPYDVAFKDLFKATVPPTKRKWDKPRWLEAADQCPVVQRLIEDHYHIRVALPTTNATNAQPSLEMRLLEVRYIGATKWREDSSECAFGLVNGQWSAIFPKKILLYWFGQSERPDEALSLYAVLGVSKDVEAADLKKAWRRMALQWHPDTCREPDAARQFIKIQEAYQRLGDPVRRAKYDAGLVLEAKFKAQQRVSAETVHRTSDFRPPLRCDWILAQGYNQLGRFVVNAILDWKDIFNEAGQVLVTSWPPGADQPEERYVDP